MAFNPLKEKGMPVEKQLRSWDELNVTPYNKNEVHPYTRTRTSEKEKGGDKSSPKSFRESTDNFYQKVRSVNAMFGAWTIVTASISLFFAAWLAVELAGSATALGAVAMGLVIWGVFYLVSISLEKAAAASMVSCVAGVARQALPSVGQATASIFEKSAETRQADTAAAVAAAVKEELFGKADLTKQISTFVDRLASEFGPQTYRKELEKLLDDAEVQTYVREDTLDPDTMKVIHELHVNPGIIDKEKARSMGKKIKDAVSKAREEADTDKSRSEKTIDAAMRSGGMSGKEAEAARARVEDYLRRTGKAELDPEGIKRDIERLFTDPKGGVHALKERITAVDRETVSAVLAERRDMTADEARKTADHIFDAIETIRHKVHQMTGAVKGGPSSTKEKTLGKIESYLASLDQPTGCQA